ncbi:unnamed protein product [Durusdinium trenchii]|uniref:Uncharacterized protein n=1 Tax=Durusdinium trenchii TaxID=1381693 RepID=A0ABP0IY54_9DINO
MTAFKRLGLLALWLLVFAIFSACAVSGVLSTNRLVRILGSLLGLIPASLHFRTSQTQTPPRRFWRYCSVVIIVTFGSLCFLPWCPGIAVNRFRSDMPFRSSHWIRIVDTVACVSISGLAALCVSLRHPASSYVRHAIWSIWGIWMLVLGLMLTNVLVECYDPMAKCFARHLEATVFRWSAWLMLSRTTDCLPKTPSFVMRHAITLVNVATLCIHLTAAVDTFFDPNEGRPVVAVVSQLVLSGTFVFLWLLVCLNIAQCLRVSRQKLQREADNTAGAPHAEALWAKRMLKMELITCLAIAFSCTQLTWIPYKILELYDDDAAEDYLRVVYITGQRLDMLIKAVSVATLSGLLWTPKPPNVQREISRVRTIPIPVGADEKIWAAHVKVLANRGFTVSSLLDFWRQLPRVMPSFDPQRSTTTDVVRMAIIPLSRNQAPQAGGRALASIWSNSAPVPAQCMVTHNWSNLFLHLVAAILADALGKDYYHGIAEKLLTKRGTGELEAAIQIEGAWSLTYWVCAFSINQHACICDNYGSPPPVDPDQFSQWAARHSDTVTGKLYPLCQCGQRKVSAGEPNTCEVNKFHWMMRHLAKVQDGFSHLVVADVKFEVFTRAWCIAEIVESEASTIPKRIKVHSENALDHNYYSLACIDVRDCQASRQEDRDMILSHISDVEAFNLQLQLAIFGTEGLLSDWVDGPSRTALVASDFVPPHFRATLPRNSEKN